jgi:hypothetical protein
MQGLYKAQLFHGCLLINKPPSVNRENSNFIAQQTTKTNPSLLGNDFKSKIIV